MKAAIVIEADQAPVYADFESPAPAPGKSVIHVTAAAISPLTRSRASGRHYSSAGALPLIPGIDGTGVLEDGRRVYFAAPERPYGALAERCLVQDGHWFALPEGLDEVAAAALAIPGMSSWAALTERARLQAGETVLINGATGTSGRLAVRVARFLGAGKVIATGRDARSLDALRSLGAQVTVQLTGDSNALEKTLASQFEQGVDIVLDYLWGMSAQTLIVTAAKTAPEGVPIRYVQIGAISGADITLPGAALRASSLQLMGSGIGSIPFPKLLQAIRGVLQAAPSAGFQIDTRAMPLSQVAQAWRIEDSHARIVLLPQMPPVAPGATT